MARKNVGLRPRLLQTDGDRWGLVFQPNQVSIPDVHPDLRWTIAAKRTPGLAAPRRSVQGMATPAIEVEVDGHAVRVSNPDKVFFPARGETKLDLVQYYLAVGDGALRGVFERPTVLKRFPDGALGEPFFQKRVPEKRPEWLETVRSRSRAGARPTSSARSTSPTSSGR